MLAAFFARRAVANAALWEATTSSSGPCTDAGSAAFCSAAAFFCKLAFMCAKLAA